MEAPGVEHRVEEFRALVQCQSRIVEQLEKSGNDAVSARIIHDSLRASLSLYIHDQNRARRQSEPTHAVLVTQTVAFHGDQTPMRTKSVTNGHAAAIASDARVQGKAYNFRPLTEEEKHKFINAMDEKSKKILSGLIDETHVVSIADRMRKVAGR